MTRPALLPLALASVLFSGCILADDSGSDTSDTSGADETGSPTMSSTTTTTGDDTSTEMCMFHCFSGPGVLFPYTATPLDQDGDPNGALLQCQNNAGGTISLTMVELEIDEPECVGTQAEAQEVQNIGVCGDPVPQPATDAWDTWASTYANQQQRRCAQTLVDEHGCHPSPVGAQGAEEVCRYFLEYPLYYELLGESLPFTEIAPSMGEGEDCDFDMLLECDGGGSSGGGVAPFGDVDALVTCNHSYTSCQFDSELQQHIMANTSRLYTDGVRLTVLEPGERDYPGVRIVLPNRTPDSPSEELLHAFGFVHGDVIRRANTITLTSVEQLTAAFGTLFDNGMTAATVVRGGRVIRVQALEHE